MAEPRVGYLLVETEDTTVSALITRLIVPNGALQLAEAESAEIFASGAMSNPMTTLGDIIRGGTAGAPQRLAIGTAGQVLTVVSGQAAWTTPAADVGFANPMTTLGDVIYGGASGVATRLAGNITTTKKFLNQTGNGSVSAAPAWSALVAGDIPDLSGTYQPLDATLTSLAAYNTNGLLTQTAADTFTGRTITGTANQVIVTNGNGVSGNPTLSLPQDIATTSTPQFARLGLGVAADAAALLLLQGSKPRFYITDTTASSGVTFVFSSDAGVSIFSANRESVTGTIFDSGKTTADYYIRVLSGDSHHVWRTSTANNVAPTERMRLVAAGILKVGGTAARGTTEGTNHIDIFNGTAPAGTLTSGISIYSASGVPTVMDSSGNANGLGQASSPTFAGLTVNGTISASANLTIAPTGDIILNPTGNDILPTTNYDLNLGSLSLKYLTLHAAELWVETLVAQDTIATIGGRILVGPTTVLTSDLTAVATTIVVKHNEMAVGDRIYMEAAGAVEFMAVTAGPTGTGPYSYTVTRNLDASGANAWSAGDAVFNTGTTGDGFIDLYSVRGVKVGTEIGPTIVGNVRNSATYNDWSPRWAIGNLNGLYGYGSTTYGAAFGVPTGAWVKIDPTNGVRIGHDATTQISLDASGNASFAGAITASSGSIAGPLTMSGASGSIAMGSTPPTSPSAGTGIWIERTGIYSLSSNNQTSVIDSTGIRFPYANGTIDSGTPGNLIFNVEGESAGSPTATLSLRTFNFGSTQSAQFNLVSGGSSHVQAWGLAGTFNGLTVGADAPPLAMLDVYKENADTNVYADVQILRHNSSGTPAANFGGSLLFKLESSTSADQDAARIIALWTTATHASRTSAVTIQAVNSAAAMAEVARFTGAAVLKIAGSAVRGTTEGTNHIDIFNGTAPAGTLTNGISIYSSAGECYIMDAAGNATLQSPHDKDTGEWIYFSRNTLTGKVLRIEMEQLMKAINKKLGTDFIKEYFEVTS